MKVFITGIRGFLGSNLAAALEARGHEVLGSSAPRAMRYACGSASRWIRRCLRMRTRSSTVHTTSGRERWN